ncbi:haptoglobin-like isoform X2 [Scyliorhinus canicula]|uniref:haptoglobin-like isoform X2 n=1 Tax=Scyliorhinus canicula TaxID=7830 RepID=UPI0018F51761|nr:haptoglobin-like isoform X2 [Scyliorhinus canicula]
MCGVILRSMLLCWLLAASMQDHHEPEHPVVEKTHNDTEDHHVEDASHKDEDHHVEDASHKDVHCGVPANISHGHFEYLSHHDEDTYLSVIKYVCDAPVYHIDDPEEAVYICTEHNKWKNAKLKYALPACHKVSCPVPKHVDHGHFEYVTTHGTTSYLSAIKYTCDANYHERDFSDEGVYVCTIDGKWRNTDLDYEVPTCEPVECGKPVFHLETHQRIVGGRMVINGASPWSMLLKGPDSEIIDGALIDHQWVLTSAHALQAHNRTIEDIKAGIKAYIGIEDVREVDSSHEVHVEEVIYHHRVRDAVEYRNDLALVKLKENVRFSNHIMPVCLPQHDLAVEGKVGHLAGWGAGVDFVPTSHLLYVNLHVANSTACHEHFEKIHPGLIAADSHDQFCTERSPLAENVCRGDHGAAFVVEENGVSYAAGILSYDEACRASSYAVYTDVFDYVNWIKETMAAH